MPTSLSRLAEVVNSGSPEMLLVSKVSPFKNPVNEAVNGGFGSPYTFVALFALTVRTPLPTVNVPFS
ncbi:hypothetical protein D3C80_2060280 [compost metagenome]